MRRLGIVVAMTAEARSLVREPTVTDELIHLAEGILLKLSGIGPRRAGEAAKNLLGNGATALLSWGCAGALVPTLSAGSVVLANSVIGADQSFYSSDPTWHGRLLNRLKGCVDLHQGPLAESSTVLRSAAEKRNLFERTGAIAVDMESGAVARVAQGAHAPFMAVRAISDSANMAIPQSSVGVIDEFGELNLLRLLKELIRQPFELFAMIRLGWNFRTAQLTLAKVARLAGTDLLLPQ
ncbi:MAG: purine phosphorylase [bacterium]